MLRGARHFRRAAVAVGAAAYGTSAPAEARLPPPSPPASPLPPGCTVYRSVQVDDREGGARLAESCFDELVAAAGAADAVLFGEVHDDRAGHAVEAELYARMCAGGVGGRCSLSLEMIERGIEPDLLRFHRGELGVRDVVGWPNFADYAPMLHTARDSGSPIFAGNPPRPAVSLVYREGDGALADLPDLARALLPPLPLAPASAASRRKLEAVFAEVAPAKEDETAEEWGRKVDRLVAAQNLWDAGQACAVARAVAAEPALKVLHVCGTKHVEGRLGVPEHLARTDPELDVLVVIAVPGGVDRDASMADFVVVTADGDGAEPVSAEEERRRGGCTF